MQLAINPLLLLLTRIVEGPNFQEATAIGVLLPPVAGGLSPADVLIKAYSRRRCVRCLRVDGEGVCGNNVSDKIQNASSYPSRIVGLFSQGPE